MLAKFERDASGHAWMVHVGQLSVDFFVVHGFRVRFLFGI